MPSETDGIWPALRASFRQSLRSLLPNLRRPSARTELTSNSASAHSTMSTQETPCAGDEDFADSIRPSESFSCEDADTETICSISKDCDITQGHFTEDFDSTNETASMRHSADDGEASLRKQDTTMISAASNEVLALDTFATMTSNTRPVMMELPKQLPVMLLTQRDELALARAFAKSLSLMENLSFSYHADTRISITTQVNPEISREASLKASV